MVTKEIIQQSISNGTLNPKMLDQFMRDMKIRAFTYDYNIQRDLVNYHEHRFTINPQKWDLIPAWTDRRERCYPVTIKECQVLVAGTKDKYLRSSNYNKYLTPEEVTANMKFFRNSFLVFVDGNIYTDYRVKISVDKVEILFRYKDLNRFAHLEDDPNVKLDGIVTDVRIMLLPNAINAVATDLEANLFSGNVLYPNNFPSTAVAKFKEEYNYFGFWINKTNQHHFFIPNIKWNDEYKYFMLPDAPPADVTKYSIMVIGMDLIFKVIEATPTTEYFKLDMEELMHSEDTIINLAENNITPEEVQLLNGSTIQSEDVQVKYLVSKMPVPKDDIGIFIKTQSFDMFTPNDMSVSLTEFYPNVYQISNPNGYNLKLMVFYDDKSHNSHIYYDNEIEPYLRFYDLQKLYKNNTVPELLRNYQPIDWQYSFQDMFKTTPYNDVNFNNNWDGFLYKMHTIESILKHWMLFYEEFQRRTYGFLPGWYHKMSRYTNLNKKVRTSTLPEIPDRDMLVNFTEPQYIFSYKNTDISGDVKSFNWFIDGKYTVPTHTAIYHGYQYVYFPTAKISRNSVIEVERFDGVKFSYSIEFDEINSSVEIKMSKLTKYAIIVNSLFFIDPDTGEYFNRDADNKDFTLTVIDDVLGEVEVDPLVSVFNLLPEQTLRITAKSSRVIGREVQLKCRNQVIKFDARESGIDWEHGYYDNLNMNDRKSILHVKPDVGLRLRIYTNDGRLIPKISYRVYALHNYQDVPKFNIPMKPRDDMNFMVNYVGYDERLVFHRELTYPNGFIDLRGRLTRPFSLAYHDVYLDGYRLTKYDIDQISPHSFVITAAHRLHTKSCVEIYEKAHAIDNYVKFEYDEESKYIMDELVESGVLDDPIIQNYPPVDTEGYNIMHVDDIVDYWYDLIRNYLLFKFLNGDKRYDYGRWSHVFQIDSGRAMLNADDRVRYIRNIRTMFYFNHDWTVAGKTTPEPANDYDSLQYPYNPSIEMDEKDYQQNSYYVDKYNPVFDEAFEIIPDPGLEPTQDKEGASEEDTRYIPDGDFHHIDTVDREILTPEELEYIRKNGKYNPWLLDLDMTVTIEDGTVIDMIDDGTGDVRLEDKIALIIPAEEHDVEVTDIVAIDHNYIDLDHTEIDPEDVDTAALVEGVPYEDATMSDVEVDDMDCAADNIIDQDDIDIMYHPDDIHTDILDPSDITVIMRTDAHEMYLSMLETNYDDHIDWEQYVVTQPNGRRISQYYDLKCTSPEGNMEPSEIVTNL